MARRQTYARILLEVLALSFIALAVYHQTQKAGLPAEYAGAERLVIDGTPLLSGDEIEFVASTHRIGDVVRVAPAAGATERSVVLTGYYDWPGIAFDAFIALIIVGLGMFVASFRPHDLGANLFHLASLTTAVALVGSRTVYIVQPPWLGTGLCVVFFLAYTLIPVLFAHFTFVFPTVRWKNYRPLLTALYLLGSAIALWSGWMYLRAVDGRSVGLLRAFFNGAMIQNGFAMLVYLTGIVNFVISYEKTTAGSDRKRIRWILYGLIFGPAPFVLLWVLPQALGYSPWIQEWIFKLCLLLIPATFAISIVRYRIMDVDVLINRSLVYGIVIGTGGVAYVLLLLGAAEIAVSFTNEASIVLAACAAAAFALGFEPARRRVQAFVDRRFFRVQYNFREALRTLTEELKQCIDIRQISALLVGNIDDLLQVDRIGFFTLHEPGHRIQLVGHKGFDLLVSHGARFDIEHLRSKLELPVALDEKIEPGVAHEAADAEVFRRWGMSLVLPMLSEQKVALGFLVLGAKKSGVRFTAEDVDLLSAVTAQAGMAVERLVLQRELLFEHAEAQRLDELNRLKSYFVSSVSHDLKTPLTSIKLFAELLRTAQALPPARAKEYLEIIEGESERLTRLINNVLDFAKIERGVKEYRFAEVDLNEIVRQTLCSMQYQFRMQQFTVNTDYTADPLILQADADALTEAIINLVSNALKYSSDRREITVSTSLRDGRAALAVSDRGIGIPSADLDHLFEPFFRARSGKIRTTAGAGLGLSVVKHIVDAHGGTIEVESTVGEGSSFTLVLPLRQIPEPPPPPPKG